MTLKPKLLASTALLAAALMTGAAFAQQNQPPQNGRSHQVGRAVAKADADKDGALSHAEFIAAHEKRFVRIDLNRDGKIDRGEFLRVRDKAERNQQRREAVFQDADRNQNGVVTKEEWMALADRRFVAHDRSSDGKLTKNDRGHAKRAQRPTLAIPPEAPSPVE